MNNINVKKIAGIGMFTAIVVILQLLGSIIRIGPFSFSFVLVPIVVGAAVYGPGAGGWLGFVFGLTVLLEGDAATFYAVSPIGTIATVLIKGIGCGIATGFSYKFLSEIKEMVGIIVAAFVCPIVNTGLFVVGCLVFFMDTINSWAASAGFSGRGIAYIFLGMIGINFFAEVVINIILAPVIKRLIEIGHKSKK